MRFELFAAERLGNDPLYGTQGHMEKVFRDVLVKDPDRETFNDMFGLRFVSCDPENHSVTLGFRAEDWMRNPKGNLHGGMMASLFDTTMGMLARYEQKVGVCVTVQLNVQYMRMVPNGSDVLITAEAVKTGRTMVFVRSEMLLLPNRKVVAGSTAEFMKLDEGARA